MPEWGGAHGCVLNLNPWHFRKYQVWKPKNLNHKTNPDPETLTPKHKNHVFLVTPASEGSYSREHYDRDVNIDQDGVLGMSAICRGEGGGA